MFKNAHAWVKMGAFEIAASRERLTDLQITLNVICRSVSQSQITHDTSFPVLMLLYAVMSRDAANVDAKLT